jgi:cell division protein FtsB
MSNVRARRAGSTAEGRRATGRVPRVHTTRPVRAGLRSGVRSVAASRPGQRRPGRRSVRSAPAPGARRRPLFTGRAVLLGALILLLSLTLAGPIRQFLAGRAELVQLAADGRALDQRAHRLAQQLARQADPAYAERQARERLTYVLPGDRLVVVVDGETVAGDTATVTPKGARSEPSSWYAGLMESLSVADGDASR